MAVFEDLADSGHSRPGKEREEVALLMVAWHRLVGDGAEAGAVGAQLLKRWSEPHRRYHALPHLWKTLSAVDVLRESAQDVDAVRYAVWFHDAVYEGRSGEDEAQSARLARRLLESIGAEAELIGEVTRLVLLTESHRPGPGDGNGAVLCDADLSILGAGPEEYLAYTSAVRAEYRHVPDRVFRQGRLQFLQAALERPHLFHTGSGRRQWETRARANMRAEVERLTPGVWGAAVPRPEVG